MLIIVSYGIFKKLELEGTGVNNPTNLTFNLTFSLHLISIPLSSWEPAVDHVGRLFETTTEKSIVTKMNRL